MLLRSVARKAPVTHRSGSGNRSEAMEIAVRRPKRYGAPLPLEEVSGSAMPPQSFQYLT